VSTISEIDFIRLRAQLDAAANETAIRDAEMQAQTELANRLGKELEAVRRENAGLKASLSEIVTTDHESKQAFINRVRAVIAANNPASG
jgi:hypothetical protein